MRSPSPRGPQRPQINKEQIIGKVRSAAESFAPKREALKKFKDMVPKGIRAALPNNKKLPLGKKPAMPTLPNDKRLRGGKNSPLPTLPNDKRLPMVDNIYRMQPIDR